MVHENYQKEAPQIDQDEEEEPEDQELEVIPNGLQSTQIENEVVHEQDEEHEDEDEQED
jgi:hypothetical protein